MSNTEEKRLVPKWRFPEFTDAVVWESKTLEDISEVVRGGSPRPIDDFVTQDLNGLSWLKIGDISSESKYIVSTKEKVTKEALAKTREVFPGDLILSNSMSFGRPYVSKIKTCIHDGWIAIRQIRDDLTTDFLYYIILNENSQSYFHKYAAGAAVLNLNAEIIKQLPLGLPSLAEQQKIADCLSSLDELITAHSGQLEALKAHKKGLLQQLFPAEGEKVPRLRFAEFQDSGEWEEKRLESLCLKISDGIHTTPNYDEEGDYYFINGNNLIAGKIHIDEKTKRVSEHEYLKHRRDLNGNSILLSINGTIGNIASYNNEKVVLGKSACYINTNEHKVNKDFISYYLKTEAIGRYFNTELTGSTIKNLSLTTIKNTVLGVPCKEEQQKIASCLSSVDERITAQTEKIAQLKLHKKGLMQGLFPTIQS